jgi:hypothetical protein
MLLTRSAYRKTLFWPNIFLRFWVLLLFFLSQISVRTFIFDVNLTRKWRFKKRLGSVSYSMFMQLVSEQGCRTSDVLHMAQIYRLSYTCIPVAFLCFQSFYSVTLLLVFFLLGDATTPEFYVPTFRDTACSISIGNFVPTSRISLFHLHR